MPGIDREIDGGPFRGGSGRGLSNDEFAPAKVDMHLRQVAQEDCVPDQHRPDVDAQRRRQRADLQMHGAHRHHRIGSGRAPVRVAMQDVAAIGFERDQSIRGQIGTQIAADQVGGSDEIGDERRARIVVDIAR